MGNAATKIYQTDKEVRQSNISQAEVRDHSYSDGGGALYCIIALWNLEK